MNELILPIGLATGLLTFGLIARWYVYPALRRRTLADALAPILLLHGFRYVGLAFLVPGVTAEPLDPRFAVPAAYGDLAAAALALLALAALRRGRASATALVWTFNVFGAADLLNAVVQGLRFTPDGHLGATFFIPLLIVPALLVSHALVLRLQLDARRRDDGARAVPDERLAGR